MTTQQREPRDEFDAICRMLVDAIAPPIVSTPEEVAARRAERMERLSDVVVASNRETLARLAGTNGRAA